MKTNPEIEPENFTMCPFLLIHPENDKWTPVRLSHLFFDKLKCKKEIVLLENAGHVPIEQPGLRQLEESTIRYLNAIS
jgi:pimeloyl-ACP methyl ester carboxylesterase